MIPKLLFKNTFLLFVSLVFSCGNSSSTSNTKIKNQKSNLEVLDSARTDTNINLEKPIILGADNSGKYLLILKNKKVGVVTNQTGILSNGTHLVDYLLEQKIEVTKIFAPEHGFRGTADAGEHVASGRDSKTGLPIISLYGNNKKPKPEQLTGIDVMIFDIQDVGARFYTYISTLHYVMEACAEQNIPLLVLDRPNPNIDIVDGPILEEEFKSFVGMHKIPVLHGMTIGEYAKMINGEKWLEKGIQCKLTVIPCENYTRNMSYSLPVKPSPNLPNDQAINLYASLCFFEGTNVSVGRGTEKQFQVYGSPYLKNLGQLQMGKDGSELFEFIPKPNEGAKDPLYNGITCYGHDLSKFRKTKHLELFWLIIAYDHTEDKSKFFNSFFTKLAGTKKLQQQIESGIPEKEIRASWQEGLERFKEMRKQYLIYE